MKRSGNGYLAAPGRFFRTAVVAYIAAGLAVLYLPFALGQKHFFHDSLSAAAIMGLFYDRVFSADSWLWSSALNGGHPLWPSFEVFPIVDPVAVVVYGVAVMFGASWMVAYQVSTILWLFLSGLGSALCAHYMSGNRWAGLLAFVLMTAGPFVLSIPAQSSGTLIPFRYFPLAFYFYLCLRDRVNFRRVFFFATMLAFCLDGYQSVYPFLAFVTLILAELLLGGRRYFAWLRQFCSPRLVWTFLIPASALAPVVAWLEYTAYLVGMPQEFLSRHAYIYTLQDFFRYLAFFYTDIFQTKLQPPYDHTASSLGFLALPMLLIGLRHSILGGLQALRSGASRPGAALVPPAVVLPVWLMLTLVLACGAFGIRELVETHGSILGVRNFAFLVTPAIFILVLLAARGFSEIVARGYSPPAIAIDGSLLLALGLLLMYWPGTRSSDMRVLEQITAPTLAILLVGFVALAALFSRVRSRFGVLHVSVFATAAIAMEMFLIAGLIMPSWDMAVRHDNQEQVIQKIRTQAPTFGVAVETLPEVRRYEFPVAQYWPFHIEGPAIWQVWSAHTAPLYNTPLGHHGLSLTHLFRLRGYHELLTKFKDRERLMEILGVSRPILELVHRADLAAGPEGTWLATREVAAPNAARAPPAGVILEVEYGGDRLAVRLRSDGEAVLIYRDNIAPGWSVRLDGRPAELSVVDAVNKAVAVPAGLHLVEFLYRPWPYLFTFHARTAALIFGALACFVLLIVSRMERGAAGRAAL